MKIFDCKFMHSITLIICNEKMIKMQYIFERHATAYGTLPTPVTCKTLFVQNFISAHAPRILIGSNAKTFQLSSNLSFIQRTDKIK